MTDKIKILIADDDPNLCETLKDILEEKGYSVETVGKGFDILSYLRENSPDILILDLMLPERTGMQLFSPIKAISGDIKIIIYTGFEEYKNSVFAQKADKFLLKSESPEELLKAIEEMME